ncbi:MAG: glycosyltransferase family 4 protein [Chloroflexi bacterium]|nr:glycosyltransferase family 4 protein [Chloroflexota bacterium]MCA2000925.1 glycosyltransferase family 4 protein [Chloroflexota bacterium]
MKIGFVIYGSLDTLSGGYLYDRKLTEYLRAQGDTVEIISLPWRNYAAHLTDNLTFKLPPRLDILIQDELNHPSLIGANRRPHPYPIVSLAHHLRCSELRPPWQNAFYRIVEKKYLQSVDGFIFNSQTTQGAVKSLIGNSKPGVIAYPPTDRFGEAVSKEEIRERAKSGELRILFLGNVIERKGLHTLLEALKLSTSNLQLDIIGSLTADPAYSKKMRDFVTVNGLQSAVRFHGALDNEALVKKLRQAHILIVPSSYEGFGIVYLEGMCFGLPAVGATAGAAGEIIEHGKTGYLIQPNDSAALAAHISELASNRSLLTELSLNARRRYTQQPAWNETASQIRTFLQSLTQQQ